MKRETQYVVCVRNKGYPASLELRKIYQVVRDEAASRLNQIRVIDESGEDYLHPQDYFAPVKLPHCRASGMQRQRHKAARR